MRPGYRTTEFWLSFAAMLVGAAMSSGAFADTSDVMKYLGMGASLLSALGYTVCRTWAKSLQQ
jgi:hypothetical protein